ncbi:MAG: hypothetical protein JKY25_08630 [Robiginitomaculum sp.]|nr:hypothetical protein [Robiginitomaculum sp.]
MKVGAAQFASEIGDVEANMEIHLDWITRGLSKKLDLLVMPELSLVGYHGTEHLLDVAMKSSDRRLRQLSSAAGDMAIVLGFIEEGPAALFYNTAVIMQNGKVIHRHRKINVPNYGKLEEGKYFAKGRHVRTCSLDEDWDAGLLICSDAWNPALTHLAFLADTTLLITPVSSGIEAVGPGFDNPGGWELTMRFYSMMYGVPSIMVNRVGVERDLTFWGGSCIFDPFGKPLAVAGKEEELIVAELDYNQVRKARHQLPTVRDSDTNLVQSEIRRLVEVQDGRGRFPGNK